MDFQFFGWLAAYRDSGSGQVEKRDARESAWFLSTLTALADMIQPGDFCLELLAIYLPSSFRSWLSCRRYRNTEATKAPSSIWRRSAILRRTVWRTHSLIIVLDWSNIKDRVPKNWKINLDAGSFGYILRAYFCGHHSEARSAEPWTRIYN